MKKSLKVFFILLFIILTVLSLSACTDEQTDKEKNYKLIDYAQNVYLNTEKYPELANQGLYWWGWDRNSNEPIILKADTEAGAALIDTNKPTVIFVHGWGGADNYSHLSATYLYEGTSFVEYSDLMPDIDYKLAGRAAFTLNEKLVEMSDFADSTEYSADDGNVYYAKAWMSKGFNFGTFYYNKFSSDSIIDAEQYIYFDKDIKAELQGDTISEQGSLTEGDASQYSLSQFFAAEYARAMNRLPKTMGDKEIRIAGHSLGGIMTTVGTRVIAALVEDGQISQKCMPSRIALLDTYLGWMSVSQKNTFEWKNYSIAWSGEKLVNNTTSQTYISYIADLKEKNVAVELYLLEGGAVPVMSSDGAVYKVMDYASTVVLPTPMFDPFEKFGAGHVGVMDWYAFSVVSDEVIVLDNDGKDTAQKGPSAVMSTAEIETLAGSIYVVTDTIDGKANTFSFSKYRLREADKTDAYGKNAYTE